MSVDAVAVLNVPMEKLEALLPPPVFEWMTPPHLTALGDATLFNTFVRWDATQGEFVAALRRLGVGLDLHRDVRGVTFFPDAYSPSASTYDGLVAELGQDVFWIPLPLIGTFEGRTEEGQAHLATDIERLAARFKAAEDDPVALAALQAELMVPPAGPRPGKEIVERALDKMKKLTGG